MSYVHRLGYLGSRVSIQATCHSKGCLSPPALLCYARLPSSPRPLLGGPSRNARSYFWSSSPKASQEYSVERQPPTQEAVSDAPTAPEQPPVDSAVPPESASAAGDVPLAGTEVASVPADVPVDVSVVSSVPPLHYGDLASLGLAGWTPAGICRWGIEALQVSTGMPWFWAIASATVIARVILFPFTVRSLRSTAALAPHTEEITRLREKMQEAQANKDMLLLQMTALKQRGIYEKAGVSMFGMAMLPFIQLPVTLGMFFGIKKICDLPVAQLKDSGVPFWTDLTAADPTGILPIAAAVLLNLQLSLGAREMITNPMTAHMLNFFRVLSLVSIPLAWHLPAGVMVYLCTSIISMMVQSIVLRQHAVRRFLRIPILQAQHENKPATFKESIGFAKKWWQEKKKMQEAAVRASREAGRR